MDSFNPAGQHHQQAIADLYQSHASTILAVLVRIYGPQHLDLAEDVLHDAFNKALTKWEDGMPDNPVGWLMQTAKNKVIDELRAHARHRSALVTHIQTHGFPNTINEAFEDDRLIHDDKLRLIFMCCDLSVKPENRIPLVLKTLCGMSLSAISRALILPESTIKKRLFRTRQKLKSSRFAFPSTDKVPLVMDSVHTILYLLFHEGFHHSDPESPLSTEICREAMRLVGSLAGDQRFANRDTIGLYALMHFHMGRVASRLDEQGHLVPLSMQNRQLWQQDLFGLAIDLLQKSDDAPIGASGRFAVEALIASEHCRARCFTDTNWHAIVSLYESLIAITGSPVAQLNHAIALGYSGELVNAINRVRMLYHDGRLKKSHLPLATLAHLYAMSGDHAQAYQYADIARARGGTPAEHRGMMRQIERLLESTCSEEL